MSQNFFAALDDSGDEAPVAKGSAAKKREPKNVKKPAPATTDKVAEPSKTGGRRANNDRNTKHGRGGRAPARDGKRAYDRRSGTGRGKEVRKGGGGPRNWGNDKADAKKMEGTIDENKVEEQTKEPVEGEEPAAAEPVEEKPEDKTMTLAEYKASKGKKEESTGREAENVFQGVAVKKAVEEDFLVMGGGKSKKTKKAKEGKQTVDVGFRVAKTNTDSDGGRGGRGRGDRDGRGGRGGRGGRDGRGRGRGRGGGGRGSKGPGINVQDEAAFPSL